MRTYTPKASEIERSWYVIDADGLVLGRVATEVARLLRGKHKPTFTPHIDTGDHVVVINADKIVLTSNKGDKVFVHRHSGYPGGIRSQSYGELLRTKPEEARPPRGARHAAEEPPRPADDPQAQGVRPSDPSPRGPAAASRSRSSTRALAADHRS